MKNENIKIQKALAKFTCEQLLFEVHRRNNIFISSWWNRDHIQEYTGLPMEYHTNFIEYCNDISEGGESMDDLFDGWLESIKEKIHYFLVRLIYFRTVPLEVIRRRNPNTGAEVDLMSDGFLKEKYQSFLSQRLKICYDSINGIYPSIDLSYNKEDPDAEEIRDIISDLIDIFGSHRGNLKTHLEEEMQEEINDYFS